jgi:hypothetical protein
VFLFIQLQGNNHYCLIPKASLQWSQKNIEARVFRVKLNADSKTASDSASFISPSDSAFSQSTTGMAVIWGLDLREIKWSKFSHRNMWNDRYHLRRTKFIVYQAAMILCVVSESLGTAALSGTLSHFTLCLRVGRKLRDMAVHELS